MKVSRTASAAGGMPPVRPLSPDALRKLNGRKEQKRRRLPVCTATPV